jgi:hypothetical protein
VQGMHSWYAGLLAAQQAAVSEKLQLQVSR